MERRSLMRRLDDLEELDCSGPSPSAGRAQAAAGPILTVSRDARFGIERGGALTTTPRYALSSTGTRSIAAADASKAGPAHRQTAFSIPGAARPSATVAVDVTLGPLRLLTCRHVSRRPGTALAGMPTLSPATLLSPLSYVLGVGVRCPRLAGSEESRSLPG